MSKEVVVDARWLYGGIGTYIRNLLHHLRPHSDGLRVRALARRQDAARLASICDQVTIVDVPIYTIREQVEIPWAARGSDLLHIPHYNMPLLFRRKTVVTILDLIHITDSAFARSPASSLYARPMLKSSARRASHIVAISNYSKDQIIERLRVSPSKVTMIYCGVEERFRSVDVAEARAKVSAALSIRCPYLLYVGNLKPHKNVRTLIRAFGLLHARKAFEPRLVIVDDDRKQKEGLVRECVQLGINQAVSFVPQVSDELLPYVYASAELLVLPSYIEGFGLPVVEAMACGTPVVCSRAASLPEVAGDAAEFFDPSSPEELAATIERILKSAELRSSMRRRGLEQASRFTWSECARRHCEVYRQVLQV
jgi:glycosyltransferase involved in cell wall biosynthesis